MSRPPAPSKHHAKAHQEAVERSLEAMRAMAYLGRVPSRKWARERPPGTMCVDALRIHFGTWNAAVSAAIGDPRLPRTGEPVVPTRLIVGVLNKEMAFHGVDNLHALATIAYPDDDPEAHKAQARWRTWRDDGRAPTKRRAMRDIDALRRARQRVA